MKTFIVKKNKKKNLGIISLLLVLAVVCFVLGGYIAFKGIFQLFGVALAVIAISIFTSVGSGNVKVKINDEPDGISHYPKLYIISEKSRHNVTNEMAVVSFNRIVSMEKTNAAKKVPGYETHIILANISPREAYVIKYKENDFDCALVCDFGEEAAAEIQKRIEQYSGLEEEDGM